MSKMWYFHSNIVWGVWSADMGYIINVFESFFLYLEEETGFPIDQVKPPPPSQVSLITCPLRSMMAEYPTSYTLKAPPP